MFKLIYCPGLNCVVWQRMPHFNHSGREKVVYMACCTLGLKYFTVSSYDTSGFLEYQF